MTIFLKIAKEVFHDKAKIAVSTSEEADASILNSTMTIFGSGRDKSVSSIKREEVVNLSLKVQELKDSATDEDTLGIIKNLISTSLTKMSVIRGSLTEGETEKALKNLSLLLDSIYKNLGTMNLRDIPYDASILKDEMDEFRELTASFCAKKIAFLEDLNFLQKLITHKSISSVTTLFQDQETLLVEGLRECSKHINTFDTLTKDINSAPYREARQLFIIKFWSDIQRTNIEYCEKYSSVGLKLAGGFDPSFVAEGLIKIFEKINKPSPLVDLKVQVKEDFEEDDPKEAMAVAATPAPKKKNGANKSAAASSLSLSN